MKRIDVHIRMKLEACGVVIDKLNGESIQTKPPQTRSTIFYYTLITHKGSAMLLSALSDNCSSHSLKHINHHGNEQT